MWFDDIPKRDLEEMLRDAATDTNIHWTADGGDEMTLDDLAEIRPRWAKRAEEKKSRTKKRAEVFTPTWIVDKMNGFLDEERSKHWADYVRETVLEITCGEAPFITTRYDPNDGVEIPPEKRVGALDRKLRAIPKNERKLVWAEQALNSVYGYEYAGDSLMIARANVYRTIREYLDRTPYWLAFAVRMNFWQMNGLTGHVCGRDPIISDWKTNKLVYFSEIKSNGEDRTRTLF